MLTLWIVFYAFSGSNWLLQPESLLLDSLLANATKPIRYWMIEIKINSKNFSSPMLCPIWRSA